MVGSGQITGEVYNLAEDEVLEDAADATEPQEEIKSHQRRRPPRVQPFFGAPAAPSDEDVPLAPSEDEPLAPPEKDPQSEPSVPTFVSVPKAPKLTGPPAKLARDTAELRIPVRLVPAARPRSVYISDAELDRGAPSSSQPTHTPKSVPPCPGRATQGAHPVQLRFSLRQHRQGRARPRSSSATPIAGSVPPAPKMQRHAHFQQPNP